MSSNDGYMQELMYQNTQQTEESEIIESPTIPNVILNDTLDNANLKIGNVITDKNQKKE